MTPQAQLRVLRAAMPYYLCDYEKESMPFMCLTLRHAWCDGKITGGEYAAMRDIIASRIHPHGTLARFLGLEADTASEDNRHKERCLRWYEDWIAALEREIEK